MLHYWKKKLILTLFLITYCSWPFAGDLDISCRWGCLYSPWSDLLICFSRSMCISPIFSVFFLLINVYYPASILRFIEDIFHSYLKVIEIVDRYDTDCVPPSSRNNMVAYIQGEGDKICNRTIMVDIFFYGNLVPSIYDCVYYLFF